MQTLPTPLQSSDRAVILDVLRGFALFGIFLNNIYGFSGYGFFTEQQQQGFASYSFDRIADFLQIALIEGKFYSLFSLLFGIGFSIMLVRGEKKEGNAILTFYRRLFILFIFGAIHLLFWQGDILFLYALVGMLLPLFRNCKDKTLLICAILLLLLPIGIDAVKFMMKWTPSSVLMPIALKIDTHNGITDDNWRRFLFDKENGLSNWVLWQETAWIYRLNDLAESNRFPKVLGVFLIGFYAGRKLIHANLDHYQPLLKKVMYIGLVYGIPMNIVFAYFQRDDHYITNSVWGFADTIMYSLAVVPLALGYAATIAILFLKIPTLLSKIAPVGRMALSMYLMQTMTGILLFYGAFAGFGQQLGLIWMFPVVLVIYAMQVILSSYWLRYFNYGPLEWVWRQLTYGKRIPLWKYHAKIKIENSSLG